MNFILIIIGGLLFLTCGVFYLGTASVIRNKENWDEFYKRIEEQSSSMSEEALYGLVCKLNFWFALGTIFGVMMGLGGILLQVFSR